MKGVDISHHQKGLTIRQLKDAGQDFAIIKLTEGTWFVDNSAFDFYLEAYKMGFPIGCYCYSHAISAQEAKAEAAFLLDTINKFPMPCGIFLDIEEPKQLALGETTLLNIVRAWCETIANAGYTPGVYGSFGTLWQEIGPRQLPEGTLVWMARWGSANAPAMCDLWQNSDNGSVEGYNGPVDTDEAVSDFFMALVKKGYPDRKDEQPAPDGDQEGEADVSGAFALLAEYIQTEEFQAAFLAYARKKGAE